jgi:hypothetical protein
MRKKRAARPQKPTTRDVVRIEDLAPRKRVVGGSGKLLFGERLDPRAHGSAAETERQDRRS